MNLKNLIGDGVADDTDAIQQLLDTGAPYVADTAAELTEYLLSL